MLQISYPMENGIVKKWDDMQHLWDYTFFEKLKVDPRGRKILLTEPPMNPSGTGADVPRSCSSGYGFAAVYVATQAVLALYAQGKLSREPRKRPVAGRAARILPRAGSHARASSMDSGDGVTHIVPVYESVVLEPLCTPPRRAPAAM